MMKRLSILFCSIAALITSAAHAQQYIYPDSFVQDSTGAVYGQSRAIVTVDGEDGETKTVTEKAYTSNGRVMAKGWQTIEKKRYYFDENGFLWTKEKGWLVQKNNRFPSRKNG